MQIRDIFQLLVALYLYIVIIPCIIEAKQCSPGFYLLPNRTCIDDNECGDDEYTSEARCGANTECYNTPGSFYCTCKKGFSNQLGTNNFTSRMNCRDIDECETDPCGLYATCTNKFGGFECGCNDGFVSTTGERIFTNKSKTQCRDIDECESDPCGLNAECTNTFGDFQCRCNDGFVSTTGEHTFTDKTSTQCQDIDECYDADRCGPNATCTNTNGAFNCSCKQGYTTNTGGRIFTNRTKTQCQDVDECSAEERPCGHNANCENTPGGFYCTCNPGFIATNGNRTFINKTQTQCKDIDECMNTLDVCGYNASCYNKPGAFHCTCDGGFVSTNGEPHFINKMETQCQDLKFFQPKSSSLEDINAFAELYLTSISNLRDGKSKELISNFLNMMEKHTILAARNLHHKERKSFSANEFDISIQAIRNNTIPKDGKAKLATAKNSMSIDWNTVAGKEDFDVAAAALISYKQLDSLMDTSLLGSDSAGAEYEFISEVVTAAVTNPVKDNLKNPITLTFENTKVRNRTAKCVYWENSTDTWSDLGCKMGTSNATFTVCSCTHLSSFAVLMALHEIKDPSHIYNLHLITNIGIILSLVCLFFCILTFILCRPIKSIRTTIHTHLCVSLFLAELLFLTGISRVGNKIGCAIIAGLLHYLFLACFAWMLLEGVQLYLMLVKVFKAKSLQLKYMLLFGYGFPLLVVVISAVAYSQGYGTAKYCWLDLESGFVWAFLLPVCIIILVNAGFFIITVWRLVDKFSSLNPDMNELKKIRTFTFTAIAQLCLLGCTWIFGMLHFQEGTIAMAYIFTIINSLQGTFIFTLHCLFNKQVRDEYSKIFITACHMKKTSKYSEFSTASTQGLRSTHETGM